MGNKSSSVGPILIAVLVTAVVVGGGVYYFQKNTEQAVPEKLAEETPVVNPQIKAPTPPKSLEKSTSEKTLQLTATTSQKSILEYYRSREDFRSSLRKSPQELGFKEVARVKISCPNNFDGPCGEDLIIVSKSSVQPGSQEFYLAQEGGAGYDYFGPFTDDLTRLVRESRTIDVIPEPKF